MRRIILKNGRIFDGSGSASFTGSVLIEGDRIAQVGRGNEGLIGAGDAEIVDCAGATVMPGMIEAHGHLTWPSSTERFEPRFMLPPEEMMLAAARNGRILLDHGFTSVFSAGALGERIEVVLRDEFARGALPGPRLLASTIERSPEGAEGIETGKKLSIGEGPEAMRAFVTRCHELGIDTVKLVLSGEDQLLPGSSQHILYHEDEVTAACETAHKLGMRVAAHTQAAEAVKIALRSGVDILYHCTHADAEALDMLAAHKDRIFMAPAVGVLVGTMEATPPPHIDMSSMKAFAAPAIEMSQALVPELKRRGVRVLPGGDYGFPFNPNGANARDLQHFVDLYGYTPAEALSAATMLGGQIMGMGGELGLVRPGYIADLLIVDGDPTANVAILQDKANLRGIMQAGSFYKTPAPVASCFGVA
ncbi:amidohydrolase family protein [Sphingomonas sp. G-3-2-10]|uniref:amidohydrolase family protein n=1 Tax=Sphingomonas sp. G-3-2-10 TaxID=2728838 RepID=UPI00146E0CD8|nr:amidohydrolase family protein [Sphingomonas sp. G-3-2-10]NML05879.1 amidohydrolase family protein [Sphingomonas sp. G-3-2-10]